MTTLRKMLTQQGFDWSNGKIIIQRISSKVCYEEVGSARSITPDDKLLDKEFFEGHGEAHCPMFIAVDDEAVYFPGTYDGATWCEKVYKDITKYLDFWNHHTPYVGG